MAPFGILFAIVFFYAIYSSFFRQVTEGSRHRDNARDFAQIG